MSGTIDLQRALTALNDAITDACSPRPPGTTARWTGAAGHAASIGRDVDLWDALPSEPAGAAAAAAALREAARMVEEMDCASRESVDAAIDRIKAALRGLEQILD